MVGLDCLLLLAAAFQVVTSQGLPHHGPPPEWANHKCTRPPAGVKNPVSCCQMKPIFTEEEMAGCGIQKPEEQEKQGPPHPPDCSKQECLLKLRGLLNEDNSVNTPAVSEYLNSWAEDEWKPAVDAASQFCLGEGGVPGPPQICEANRLMFCVGGVMFTECPTWQETDECKLLKDHMEECKAVKFPPPPN